MFRLHIYMGASGRAREYVPRASGMSSSASDRHQVTEPGGRQWRWVIRWEEASGGSAHSEVAVEVIC